MFDQLFKPAATIERHLQAPLCGERLLYLQYLKGRGAAQRTRVKTAPYLLAIVASLGLTSPVSVTPKQISAAADRWISRQSGSHGKKHGKAARTTFVSIANDWFRFLGLLLAERVETPHAAQLQAFTRYLREERALSPATIRMLRGRAAELLQFVDTQGVSLDRLGAGRAVGFPAPFCAARRDMCPCACTTVLSNICTK